MEKHRNTSELPTPPEGVSGWPWDNRVLNRDSIGEWPKISIVTPSFNQGKYLERTLRSIHAQRYPNLQHIVIDGGSTDNTVTILRKYESYFDYWISEPDRGQTHALNKGITKASGQIINWINSDDILYENALFEVAEIWKEQRPHLIIGGAVDVDANGQITKINSPRVPSDYLGVLAYWNVVMPQPTTFIDRELFDRLGMLREDLHYRMDWEFYLRVITSLGSRTKIVTLQENLGEILYHSECKSMKSHDGFRNDALSVWKELQPTLPFFYRGRVARWINWFETMKFVEQEESCSAGPLSFLGHVLMRPWTWSFRYTWGALRKRLSL